MNRWARIVLALSAFATVGWTASALAGYRVDSDATLARHTLFAFAVLLALVLTHGWVAVFALVANPLVRRRAALPAATARALAAARRLAVAAAVVAIAAALAQFLAANALDPARLRAAPHAFAGWASVALLVLAWLAERHALARHGRALATLAE
jgi:hypothetical protein